MATLAPTAMRSLLPSSRRAIMAAPRFALAAAAAQPSRSLRSLADLAGDLQGQATKATTSPSPKAATSDVNKGNAARSSTAPSSQSLIVTLSCPDRSGIVHKVTGWLASRSFDIRDSAQYGDGDTQRFFMRVHANGPKGRVVDMADLVQEFKRDVADEMSMKFEIADEARKPKTLLMVSKIGRE